MRNRPLFWVLLPLALVAVLFLLAVFFTALAFTPPHISAVALGIFALVIVWAVLRRRSTASAGLESSLFRRQKSSEGLL